MFSRFTLTPGVAESTRATSSAGVSSHPASSTAINPCSRQHQQLFIRASSRMFQNARSSPLTRAVRAGGSSFPAKLSTPPSRFRIEIFPRELGREIRDIERCIENQSPREAQLSSRNFPVESPRLASEARCFREIELDRVSTARRSRKMLARDALLFAPVDTSLRSTLRPRSRAP